MSANDFRTNRLADSGPVEPVPEDNVESNLSYEGFLEELLEVARLPDRLDSFISGFGSGAAFWSKGLFRVADAENDPYHFFENFVVLAPIPLRKLLYGIRDDFGYTILHKAVHRKNPKLAKLLTDDCVSFSRDHLTPHRPQGNDFSLSQIKWVLAFIHARTVRGSTALHFATLIGDKDTVDQLTSVYDKLAIPSNMVWNFLDKAWMTPLHYAVLLKNEPILKRLLKCRAYARHVNVGDWSMRTPLHIACSAKPEGPYGDTPALLVIRRLLESSRVDVNALDCCRFTPLHWAVYVRSIEAVKLILSKAGKRTIRSTEEDCDGRTVLQLALMKFDPHETFISAEVREQFYHAADQYGLDNSNENEFRRRGNDVARLLMENPGVKGEVERLYRDRQVYVDAANAILVGAALIASVTFGGWLQAPLGDNLQRARRIVRVFWIFNSLSFFFAIASVMAGAGAVLPMANVYIGDGVRRVRDWLALTAFLLLISVTCVLVSFAAAGYAAGTDIPNVDLHMTVTSIVGSIVCVLIGLFFLRGLYHIRPGWTQLLIPEQISKFQTTEKEAKNYHKLWGYWKRFVRNLGFVLEWTRGRQSRTRTSMRQQYMFEALRKQAFDRAFRLLGENDSKYSGYDVKDKLQAPVFGAFGKAYQNLKKCRDKAQQILHYVNDLCPCGLRKTKQWTPALSSGQYEDSDEVLLEEVVTEMVTKFSGRGLLHIFLDVPTTSCRDTCLRNNMINFQSTMMDFRNILRQQDTSPQSCVYTVDVTGTSCVPCNSCCKLDTLKPGQTDVQTAAQSTG